MGRINTPQEATAVLDWIAEHKNEPNVTLNYTGSQLKIMTVDSRGRERTENYSFDPAMITCFANSYSDVTGDSTAVETANSSLKQLKRTLNSTDRNFKKAERIGKSFERGDISGTIDAIENSIEILGSVIKGGHEVASCVAISPSSTPSAAAKNPFPPKIR